MKNIYILGSINTDLCINTPHMPEKGETIIGNEFFVARGGKGANQAVSAAKCGGCVKMCGAIGNDSFGKDALKSLLDVDIDCTHIKKVSDAPSGTAMIIRSNGDNRIIIDSGANFKITKEDVDLFLESSKEGDIFLTQLENPIEVVGYALEQAKQKGLFVVLNPAPMNNEIAKYLKYVDLVTPNEGECEIFGGLAELKELVPNIIVTLGSKGFRFVDKSQDVVVPCIKIKAVDTTAAGDTFVGAMMARFSDGYDLLESAKFGSLAASIACTRIGAQPSIPDLKEVVEKMPH